MVSSTAPTDNGDTMPEQDSEPRTVSPFKIIQRGEDTLDADDNVMFADFSPRVLPSEVPDEEIDELVAPKASSAQEPVQSPESPETIEPETPETVVPLPADMVGGDLSPSASSSRTSSTPPKSG